MIRKDVLGFEYDSSEPAFSTTVGNVYYYHLATKRLFEKVSFDAWLTANSLSFSQPGEVGIPSAVHIAAHEDMLESLVPVPAAPTGFNATAFSATAIDLAWTDASNNESGFAILRSSTINGVFTLVHTTAAGVQTYRNTGLVTATEYFYRLYAVNANGYSATYVADSAITA